MSLVLYGIFIQHTCFRPFSPVVLGHVGIFCSLAIFIQNAIGHIAYLIWPIYVNIRKSWSDETTGHEYTRPVSPVMGHFRIVISPGHFYSSCYWPCRLYYMAHLCRQEDIIRRATTQGNGRHKGSGAGCGSQYKWWCKTKPQPSTTTQQSCRARGRGRKEALTVPTSTDSMLLQLVQQLPGISGRAARPATLHCDQNLDTSAVPRKEAWAFTVTQHLSYPEGQSVNDHIAEEHWKVVYQSVSDV